MMTDMLYVQMDPVGKDGAAVTVVKSKIIYIYIVEEAMDDR